jgi:D-glycero-D-manno-heptose 1,7-bisphosphate phosphatase
LFLDRDGTLIVHEPYLHDPGRVVLLPGVREALVQVRRAGAKLFLFTNQSGVGRGMYTLADVAAVNQTMLDLLGLGDDLFTAVCIAPEAPGEASPYRKPSPRFIREMLARHRIDAAAAWMVGDSPVDWEAGLAAGINVAAVVPDPTAPKAPERRADLGVAAYPTLLDWLGQVCG